MTVTQGRAGVSCVELTLNVQMLEKKIATSKAASMASTTTATTATKLTVNGYGNGASEIKFKKMRFLITDRPTEATLDRFIAVSN